MAGCLRKRHYSQSIRISRKEYDWVDSKFEYMKKPLEEKRKEYKCGENFKTIEDVKRWGPDCQFAPEGEKLQQLRKLYDLPEPNPLQTQEPQESDEDSQESTYSRDTFEADPLLNNKIGILIGTIDTIEVEAVVVPCNQYFHSCKEYAQTLPLPSNNAFNTDIIHEAAGPFLRRECDHYQAVEIGSTRITGGYLLPAKFVIHTAAPSKDLPEDVGTCYIGPFRSCLGQNIRTIAFPCISSGGSYGIPPQKAAEKALRAVRDCLDGWYNDFDLIVFCLKDDSEIITYQDFLPRFFPL